MVQYKYDAWGNHKVLDASGAEISDLAHIGHLNPFRYRSYYYDSELGLYFLQSRYYDPELGRFVTIDDLSYLDPDTVNGLNLYAYCLNNPVMYSDPTGHMPEWLATTLKILGGVAIIAGAVALSVATGGIASVIFAGAAVGAILGGVGAGISTAISGGTIHDFSNSFLMGTAIGAFTGAVASSSLSRWWQGGVNALGGVLNYVGTQHLAGNQAELKDALFYGISNGLIGLLGGNGWGRERNAMLFKLFEGKNALGSVVPMMKFKSFIHTIGSNTFAGGILPHIYDYFSKYDLGAFMGFR